MEIYNLVEAKNKHPELLSYCYPTEQGEFFGTLVAAYFAPHAILHSFWDMDNGEKLDCCLFRDKHCKYLLDVEAFPKGTIAKLKFVKAESEKFWVREIEICQRK